MRDRERLALAATSLPGLFACRYPAILLQSEQGSFPRKRMSDWTILSKDEPTSSMVAQLFTLGTVGPFYIYTIEHEDSGERKRVLAEDEHELGEKISDGDFLREIDDDNEDEDDEE